LLLDSPTALLQTALQNQNSADELERLKQELTKLKIEAQEAIQKLTMSETANSELKKSVETLKSENAELKSQATILNSDITGSSNL
jgi:chromosome segregation ATPase